MGDTGEGMKKKFVAIWDEFNETEIRFGYYKSSEEFMQVLLREHVKGWDITVDIYEYTNLETYHVGRTFFNK